MTEYNVGDMVYSRNYGLGQIVSKRQVHQLMANYYVYWFEDDSESPSLLPETISYYRKSYKALERRIARANAQNR